MSLICWHFMALFGERNSCIFTHYAMFAYLLITPFLCFALNALKKKRSSKLMKSQQKCLGGQYTQSTHNYTHSIWKALEDANSAEHFINYYGSGYGN